MAEDKPLKKPFTDEQQDFLMDYLFEKYMNDMMKSKERSEDFYNQPPTTDPAGNELMKAKSNNPLMDMINKGVKDTKKEGIMMAQQYEQGGDLNYVIEMMANETDPDKLEELKMIIREMLGTTPYMSIRQSPTFKLADGGFIETLKDKLSEFADKFKNDKPRFFAGQPLNEAAENDPRYKANLTKRVYRDLGYTDEEIDQIVKEGAGDFLGLGEYLEQIESLNKDAVGIMKIKEEQKDKQ